MKSLSLVVLGSLCLTLALARVIPQPKAGDDILINVSVPSAQLLTSANAVLKVWIINPTQKLELPILPTELNNATYIEYIAAPVADTTNPQWDLTYGFPSEYFNTASQLSFEIWDSDVVTKKPTTFIGGIILSVATLEQQANVVQLPLFNEAGIAAGSVIVNYNVPKQQ